MNEIILGSLSLFKGKFPFHPFRRAFDFLLTISITYYIHRYFYGSYEWLNISDYKRILDFLIKGKFFTPFILFLTVHLVTTYIPTFLFTFMHRRRSDKWRTRIIAVDKQIQPNFIDTVAKAAKFNASKLKANIVILRIYQKVKEALTPESKKEILDFLSKVKNRFRLYLHYRVQGVGCGYHVFFCSAGGGLDIYSCNSGAGFHNF